MKACGGSDPVIIIPGVCLQFCNVCEKKERREGRKVGRKGGRRERGQEGRKGENRERENTFSLIQPGI